MSSQPARARRSDPPANRQALVDAAVEVLRHEGFAKATARHIAATASCNQGLVFYHFGSVADLLLAAMDQVSAARRLRYDAAIESVRTPSELVELAVRVFSEDLDSGDAALLVEMIAGAASTPGLGPAVRERVEPWSEFAVTALGSAFSGMPLLELVGTDALAYAVVSMYLGLELLSHLDGDRTKALEVFDRARALSSLADVLASWSSTPSPTETVRT